MTVRDDFLWVEKYRPRTIEDTILPKSIKATFQAYVDKGEIPTLLLTGKAGIGKTTAAKAMVEEIGADWKMINGSLEGRLIDTLRTTIVDFASTVSFTGGRKYIIIDEADYMNAQSVQPALRNFIEEYSSNCGFILTCNYKNKIIPEIAKSRAVEINFQIPKEEAADLAKQFFNHVKNMLKTENVDFEPAAVAEVINKYFPDWRRVVGELQRYSATGKIDSGILVNLREVALSECISLMKEKNFKELRKWVTDNNDIDPSVLFQAFYDNAYDHLKKGSIPLLVLLLSKYQYQTAFVANQEINTMAFLTEIMMECEFV